MHPTIKKRLNIAARKGVFGSHFIRDLISRNNIEKMVNPMSTTNKTKKVFIFA
jgi:hypothetical protein